MSCIQENQMQFRNLSKGVQALVEASQADNTRRSYGSALGLFRLWCEKEGHVVLPATPEVVAEYVAELIITGKRSSSIKIHVCAISHMHREAGFESPAKAYLVQAVLRGSRRLRGSFIDQKLPVLAPDILKILDLVPNTLIGRRDRAMLAVGFAGAFRRSELAALRLEDFAFSEQGATINIRKSKTDFAGVGKKIGLPNGHILKAVAALQDWLKAADITRGPVFRPVYVNRVLPRTMTPLVVSRVLKTYLEKAGLDPSLYGSHSLRAGFITSAADAGVSLEKIMDHSRHVDFRSVREYVRRSNLFQDHPGQSFL